MAHKIGDRAKETTSTTGTGSFTTTGAVSGFVALSSVMTSDGDTSWYAAQAGAEWEVGLCTRSSSTSYARTTILASSNSGSAVSFTTAPVLFLTVPAKYLQLIGGPAFRARLSSDQTISNNTWTKASFATEDFDTNGCFDSSTNYRFTPTVPGYYAFHWLLACSATTTITTSGATSRITKNGTEVAYSNYGIPSGTFARVVGSTILEANGTSDYFEIQGYISGTGTLKFTSGSAESFFSGHLVRVA